MASPAAVNDFLRLTDVDWRRMHEAENGLFVAEGEKVITRALDLGYRPRQVILTEKWLAKLPLDLVERAEVLVASEFDLEQTTGYRVHRGALASFDRPAALDYGKLLDSPGVLVLLEGLADLTNLGAIFRSAAGLGAKGVLLSPDCADPFYRRAIKVSMGATLALPHATYPDWLTLHAALHKAGRHLIALTPAGENALTEAPNDFDAGLSVLALGSEGDGLSDEVLEAADRRVSIPMSNHTDSLNVAAAAAIALWEFAARPSRDAGSNRP